MGFSHRMEIDIFDFDEQCRDLAKQAPGGWRVFRRCRQFCEIVLMFASIIINYCVNHCNSDSVSTQ